MENAFTLILLSLNFILGKDQYREFQSHLEFLLLLLSWKFCLRKDYRIQDLHFKQIPLLISNVGELIHAKEFWQG